jgi:hypothetical protein
LFPTMILAGVLSLSCNAYSIFSVFSDLLDVVSSNPN